MNARTGGLAVAWRRDLHAYPEVGFTEFRRASRVAGAVADLGWEVVTGPDAMVAGERLGIPPRAELDAAYERAAACGADLRFLPAMRGGQTAVVATLRGPRPTPRALDRPRTSAHFAPRNGTSHAVHGVRSHPAACAVGLRGAATSRRGT